MKKLVIFFAAILFFADAFAQADTSKCADEINQQVWKPFITHITSGNNEGFRSLHSKRVTRVEIDRNIVQDFEKYLPVKPNRKPVKNGGFLFELRFDKRICNGTKAWETGYYKGTILGEGKAPSSYYGRFFVVLEKEEEGWKILVDADTSKGVTEDNFNSASPME
ncbi:MAG: hypothetical protein QM737_10620 [Ferruginibacter sp.]